MLPDDRLEACPTFSWKPVPLPCKPLPRRNIFIVIPRFARLCASTGFPLAIFSQGRERRGGGGARVFQPANWRTGMSALHLHSVIPALARTLVAGIHVCIIDGIRAEASRKYRRVDKAQRVHQFDLVIPRFTRLSASTGFPLAIFSQGRERRGGGAIWLRLAPRQEAEDLSAPVRGYDA